MKSLYQTKQFAEYWNERAGNEGEAYKRYVLDPLMFKLLGSLKNKTVLELGCGNGYLANTFIRKSVKQLFLLDISKHNLAFAREKCDSSKIEFIEQDATKPWKVRSKEVDAIFSNMMLNEVENISVPIKEIFRILKPKGQFVFSVTHPAWDLYIYAQQKAGVEKQRIRGLRGYFERGRAKYIMRSSTKNNLELKDKVVPDLEFEVSHYHRTISDYIRELVKVGFEIKNILEPEPTEDLIIYNPRFKDSLDFPVSLVIFCFKP